MNEAEKLASWLECSADSPPVSPPNSPSRLTAALLRRQAEQIKLLREALAEAELVLAEKLRRLGAGPNVSPTAHRIRSALSNTKEET